MKDIEFYESCKCDCLLNETICNSKQKWNKDECTCECLKIEECHNNSFWNVVNCRCEHKKAAKLMVEEEEFDIETNHIIQNKTISIIKK